MKVDEAMRQRGLVDALALQQERSLQQGFDAGFPQGARVGFQTGKDLYARFRQQQLPIGDYKDYSQFHIAQVLK